MARKVVNRKQLREEAEAAEAAPDKKKKAKEVKKKAAAPKKKRSKGKEPVEKRLSLFWGVYNPSGKRVAKYEFNQRKAAQKRRDELSSDGKEHFVQKDKEEIEEV